MRGVDVEVGRIVPSIESEPGAGPVEYVPDPDYVDWSDEQVAAEAEKVTREHRRRQAMAEAAVVAEEAATVWLAASGRQDGQPWVRPTSTVDAYREGDVVTHEGKTWRSMTRVNTHEPPVHWREVVEEGAPPPQWVRPASTEDAYQVGELVTFEGQVWRSVWPNPNTWSPTEFPDAWQLVTEPDDEGEEPEPEPEPDTVPVWERPEWAGEAGGAYQLGDRVRFPDAEGPVYESTHDGWNTWSPDEYGWVLA